MNRPHLSAMFTALVLASCSSSGTPREAPVPPAAAGDDVAATVNGVVINRAELALVMSAAPGPHGGGPPAPPETVLAHIIDRELLAQAALAAHLDRDAEFKTELDRREAQLAQWRREQLADLYEEHAASRRPEIGEADARQYYDANATKIRTEVRVGQIMLRDEARANQALADLRAGASFDDVAVRSFPAVPDLANKPWELGFLRWNQLPEPWRPVLDAIAVGQVSDVIRGPNRRFWILKVLERRENPELTFEAMRPLVTTVLQEQHAAEARTRTAAEARRSARIVIVNATPSAAPAPPPETEL